MPRNTLTKKQAAELAERKAALEEARARLARPVAPATPPPACEHTMTRPPKARLRHGSAWAGRTTRRPGGKTWKLPCPNRAVARVDGRWYCAAHTPGPR